MASSSLLHYHWARIRHQNIVLFSSPLRSLLHTETGLDDDDDRRIDKSYQLRWFTHEHQRSKGTREGPVELFSDAIEGAG